MSTVFGRTSTSAVHSVQRSGPPPRSAGDWNLALLDEVLPARGIDGEPTVLDCDEVAIRAAAEKLGIEPGDAVDSFVAHLDRIWSLRQQGLLRARARLERGGSGAVGTTGSPPHHLGLLCLLTFVASSMRADGGGAVSNYYGRLGEILGVDNPRPAGMHAVRPLLEALDGWLLEVEEGRRGLLRIPEQVRPPHVGLLERQVIFRERDIGPLRRGLDESGDDRVVLEWARSGRLDGLSPVCLQVAKDAELEATVLHAIRDARARSTRHEARLRSRNRGALTVVLIDDPWEPRLEICASGSSKRTHITFEMLLGSLSSRGFELGERWLRPTETLVLAEEEGGAWTTEGRGDLAVVITSDPALIEELTSLAHEDVDLTDSCTGGWAAFRGVPRSSVANDSSPRLRGTLPVSVGRGLRLARDEWLARGHGPVVMGPESDEVDVQLVAASDGRQMKRLAVGGGRDLDLSDVPPGEYRLMDPGGAFQDRAVRLLATAHGPARRGAGPDPYSRCTMDQRAVRPTLSVVGSRVWVLDKSSRARLVVAPSSFDLSAEIGVANPLTWEVELQQYDCWLVGEDRVWCTNPQRLKWLKGDAARVMVDLGEDYEVVPTVNGPRESVVREHVAAMQARARRGRG